MKDGIFLLWVVALAVSGASWLGLQIVSLRHGRIENRRGMTGYELARRFVDSQNQGRVAVEVFLSERISHGTRLKELGQALHEAAHWVETPRSIGPMASKHRRSRILPALVSLSWALVAGGVLWPSLAWAGAAGQLIFILIFIVACAFLEEEGRVTERAVNALIPFEGLDLDEKARMKRILGSLQWLPWVEIFEAPVFLCPAKT